MKYESSFKSEADGLEISIMAVLPDQKPYRAVIQLVHGMSEHKERYLPFMKFLAKQGYVTVIHDHRAWKKRKIPAGSGIYIRRRSECYASGYRNSEP